MLKISRPVGISPVPLGETVKPLHVLIDNVVLKARKESCSRPASPALPQRQAHSQACLKQAETAASALGTGEEEEEQGEAFSRLCLTRWLDRTLSGHLGFLRGSVT